MYEIAKLSNVSIGTVGRSLNGHGRIGEITRRRVLQVARELGIQTKSCGTCLGSGKGVPHRRVHPSGRQFLRPASNTKGILAEARDCERLGIELIVRSGQPSGTGTE